MTTAIFKYETNPYTRKVGVFAFFPDEEDSYSHLGQHSLCSRDYADGCREAKFEDYEPLYREMTEIVGYKLKVLNGDFGVNKAKLRKPVEHVDDFGEVCH